MRRVTQAEESDNDASQKLWLGGEATVPRYPSQGINEFPLLTRAAGLVGIGLAVGFLGGLVFGRLSSR